MSGSRIERTAFGKTYPRIVELSLQTNILAFLLVLRAQHLELFGLQGRLDISGV